MGMEERNWMGVYVVIIIFDVIDGDWFCVEFC